MQIIIKYMNKSERFWNLQYWKYNIQFITAAVEQHLKWIKFK